MYVVEFAKPRYVRVNTNLLSRADAMDIFLKDGWTEVTPADQTYAAFLESIRTLDESNFVSDMHVNNLFVFPASSKRFWARNQLVLESKLILQDKVSMSGKKKIKLKLIHLSRRPVACQPFF